MAAQRLQHACGAPLDPFDPGGTAGRAARRWRRRRGGRLTPRRAAASAVSGGAIRSPSASAIACGPSAWYWRTPISTSGTIALSSANTSGARWLWRSAAIRDPAVPSPPKAAAPAADVRAAPRGWVAGAGGGRRAAGLWQARTGQRTRRAGAARRSRRRSRRRRRRSRRRTGSRRRRRRSCRRIVSHRPAVAAVGAAAATAAVAALAVVVSVVAPPVIVSVVIASLHGDILTKRAILSAWRAAHARQRATGGGGSPARSSRCFATPIAVLSEAPRAASGSSDGRNWRTQLPMQFSRNTISTARGARRAALHPPCP